MRKILTITIIGLIIYSCSSSQRDFIYLDIDNNEISKSKFRQKKSTNKYLDVQIDSLNQKKLIERTKKGKIENLKIFRSLISNKIVRKNRLFKAYCSFILSWKRPLQFKWISYKRITKKLVQNFRRWDSTTKS